MSTKDTCPFASGRKTQGTVTFTVDLGFGVVVVRNVRALVCDQCGADWIADDIAERLEKTVNDARLRHRQVDVTAYIAA